jgi:hypothetical protein
MCSECPVYIATKNKDNDAKEMLAAEYSTEDCTFEPDDMNCEGCFSIRNKESKMCGNCKIRQCADIKNPEKNCSSCTDYPCPIIEEFCPVGCDSRARLDKSVP